MATQDFNGPVKVAVAAQSVSMQVGEKRGHVRFLPSGVPTELFGRTSLVSRIAKRLADGNRAPRILLVGPAGIGKTALAAAVAGHEAVRRRYPNVLTAEIGPDGHTELELCKWAGLLDVAVPAAPSVAAPSRESSRLLQSVLAQELLRTPPLIIIDNALDQSHIEPFLFLNLDVPYLITTRVQGLADYHAVTLVRKVPEISETSARRLIKNFAKDVVKAHPVRVTALIQKVGGNPLALTLIARQLRRPSRLGSRERLEKTLARLDDALVDMDVDEASGSGDTALPTSKSLKAAIAVGAQSLPDTARRCLCKLQVLSPKPNTFSEETFRQVAGGGESELELLVDRSLVESLGNGRYALHRVTWLFAESRAGLPDEQLTLGEAKAALADHFVDLLRRIEKSGTNLRQESSNLLASLEVAVSRRSERVFDYIEQLQPLMVRSGLHSSPLLHQVLKAAQQFAEEGLATEPLPPAAVTNAIRVMLARGEALEKVGAWEEAEKISNHLRRWATTAEELSYRTRILVLVAALECDRGEYAAARSDLTEAMKQVGHLPENLRPRYGEILRKMGEIELNVGNIPQAFELLAYGLKLVEPTNDAEALSGMCLGLGVASFIRQAYDEAEDYLRVGLNWARQANHSERVVGILHMRAATCQRRADAARASGSPGDAGRLLNQARLQITEGLKVARAIKHSWYVSALLNECGELRVRRRQLDRAAHSFRKAVRLARRVGAVDRQAFALFSWARLERDRSDVLGARDKARKSRDLFKQMGHYMVGAVESFIGEMAHVHTAERLANIIPPTFRPRPPEY